MIAWLTTAPTPQFVPVLNALARERKDLDVRVYYRDLGDRGRGWGALPIDHPHELVPATPIAQLLTGWQLAGRPELRGIVVFGYANWLAAAALLRARLRRIPVFTQSDTSARMEVGSALKRAFKTAVLRSLYPRRSTAWVISPDNRAYWSRYGIRRFAEVPFESPLIETADTRTSAEAIRARFDPESRILLSVARVSPEKGVDTAVAAVTALRARGVQVELVVVGDREESIAPSAPGVHFLGPVPRADLAAIYEMANAFVLASRREQYGLAVREALQFGLPVVATDGVPAATHLCDRGWNIVPRDNPDKLAAALERAIAEMPWERQPPIDTAPFYGRQLSLPLIRATDFLHERTETR